jgi:hypothetical protein
LACGNMFKIFSIFSLRTEPHFNSNHDEIISETTFYTFLGLSMASMSVTLILEFCAVYTRMKHRGECALNLDTRS